MLYQLKELIGDKVYAKDDKIGKVIDFYYDMKNKNWKILYVLISVNSREQRRRIIVSAEDFERIKKLYSEAFYVDLSQVDLEKKYEKRVKKDLSYQLSQLQSVRTVLGYRIKTKDGEYGYLGDFIIDDKEWIVRYVLVDKKKALFFGKQTLLPKNFIKSINYTKSSIHVDIPKEQIEKSVDYKHSTKINKEYEEKICDYYKKSGQSH